MNRILLIGNGFDLEHGLATKYEDFINNFWKNKADDIVKKYIENSKPSAYGTYNMCFNLHDDDEDVEISNLKTKINYIPHFNTNKIGYNYFLSVLSDLGIKVDLNKSKIIDNNTKIKNKFLLKITNKLLKNWVDIEIEYYDSLKECFKNESIDAVKQLNHEFKSIKNALEIYLLEESKKEIVPSESIKNLMDNIITENCISKGLKENINK